MRKVIGSSPISSTKPLVKTSGFFFCYGRLLLSSGKSLAVGQVIGSRPISSTKPDRKVGLFLLSSGKPLAVGQVIDLSPISSTKPLVKTSGFFLFIALLPVRKFDF